MFLIVSFILKLNPFDIQKVSQIRRQFGRGVQVEGRKEVERKWQGEGRKGQEKGENGRG